MNKIMLDAFKALDNIDDELVTPVKKAVNKDKRINESKVSGNAKKAIKEEAEEKYVYQFFPLTKEDKSMLKKYNLEFMGRQGKGGFQPGDSIVKGTLENLKKYCKEWLGYEMHPDYLCKEGDFCKDFLESCDSINEAPITDLSANYDNRKSFYGKARVDVKDNGTKVLYSYGTPVCRIEKGKATLLNKGYLGWSSSQTTLRHVKEFLKQNGFEVASLRELAKMYPIEQARDDESLKESMDNVDNIRAYLEKNGVAIDTLKIVHDDVIDDDVVYLVVNYDDERTKPWKDIQSDLGLKLFVILKDFSKYDYIEDILGDARKHGSIYGYKTYGYQIPSKGAYKSFKAKELLPNIKDAEDAKECISEMWRNLVKLNPSLFAKYQHGIIDSDFYKKANGDARISYRIVNREIEDNGILRKVRFTYLFDNESKTIFDQTLSKDLEQEDLTPSRIPEEYIAKINTLSNDFDESLKEEVVDLSKEDKVKKAKKVLKDDKSERQETIVDVDAETIDELKDSYVGNAILRCPVCRTLIYKKPDDLKQDGDNEIYNVDEECPHCHSQDGFELVGQVAELTKDEAEAEVETTTGKENDAESEEASEEEPKRTTRIDTEESLKKEFVVEDIDETRFDRLINQYLVSTYNNVEGYATTNGKVDNDNNILVLEGKIKYKSGKEKATSFVFEAKSSTKGGRIRFAGINETFTKSRNAFSLYGRISKDGCLRCESMHYSYGVKVLDESKLVKGKVEIKEKKSK